MWGRKASNKSKPHISEAEKCMFHASGGTYYFNKDLPMKEPKTSKNQLNYKTIDFKDKFGMNFAVERR